MITYNGETFKDVTSQGGLVLVDFFATWCGPCKMIMPVLEEISKERTDVKIVKVDIDEHRPIALQEGVRSVPTLILYKDGLEIAREVGFQPKEKLNEWLDTHK